MMLSASTIMIFNPVMADESELLQRIDNLENRITVLEQLIEENNAKSRWKDPILWQRIKKERAEPRPRPV